MKNKHTFSGAVNAWGKTLLIMKLTLILTVFSVFQSFAGIKGQSVSIDIKDMEIRKVLNRIERQGTFRFLFNSRLDEMKKKVDISTSNENIETVLGRLFNGTGLSFKKLDNNLIAIRAGAEDEVNVTVSGRIIGPTGDPLNGVSITIKGTSTGTTSNANGEYALSVPDNATIVFTYVGYTSQEVAVAGKTSISVTLQASTRVMDEVVVIGYGQASKRDLTGSIVKVSGKEIADKPNTNPVSSLQSKVAGLYVVNSGTPGAAPDVRIRGTVSIGNVHPLYVVDGIFNDNIDFLNPNDIESIEVLKDPSSLAIFGVKGATGVIAVTTKKAKIGKPVINFNTSYGFKKLVDKIKMANASQFNTLFAEEMANDGNTVPDYSKFNSNTDWIDAVTHTGIQSMSNLSIASSSQTNRFTFGLGYTSDEGMLIHEKLQKILLSLSDEVRLTKDIKLGVNLNAARIQHPYDATNRLDDARKVQPQVSALPKVFKVQDPYGLDSIDQNIYSALALQGSGVVNPVLEIENTWNKTTDIEYRYVGSVYADINFLKHFNFRATWYGDLSNEDKRVYTPLYYSYTPYDNSVALYSTSTSLQQNNNDWKKFQQDYILTYKKSFGRHNLTATGGFTTYYSGEFLRQAKVKQGTSASDLPIPNDKRFWYISSGFGVVDPANTNSTQDEYSTVSGLGRVLYNYNGKYYFNASIRNDASSRLVGKNRNQQFWALGAAWEISKEEFFKGVSVIDFLKLKGSVGVLGNQTASQLDGTPLNYPAYPNLQSGVYAVFGNSLFNAAQPAYIANPNLKWETVNSGEVGIELNAFGNRLHFEANYYDKTTKNLMTFVDRSEKGLPNELINGGSLKNTGEEFTATWTQNLSKDLTINLGGNITFMQNKVLSLAADLPSGYLSRAFENNGSAEARTIVGKPIGSFYGYIVDGLYQSYADKLASPIASSIGAYGPGDFKFKDINGPGVKGTPDNAVTSDDRTIIGNPSPKFIYGGSVNVAYKGINLSVDIGGVYGNDVFRTWGSLESPYQRVNYPEFKMNRWHGAGTSNWDPINSQQHRFNYNGSTYNIEDGSYVRIRNLQLGYNLSQRLISRVKMQNVRVFANVQNLKTWKHNSGYTPEYGGDATAFGFDFAGGALPRILTFGLNVTF
jgi:TonB-linked SusC/RagA family outer membrane protein